MRRPYGRVNLIGLVLLAAVVGVLYAFIMFSPVYADNFDVQEAVNAAFNQLGSLTDSQVRDQIRGRLIYVGTHQEYGPDGYLHTVPGMQLSDEQIVIERNVYTHNGLIRVDYEREVLLKPTTRIYRVHFHPMKTGPLNR